MTALTARVAFALLIAPLMAACAGVVEDAEGPSSPEVSATSTGDYGLWEQWRLAEETRLSEPAPSITPVRDVTPGTQLEAISSCMEESGFVALPDGSYEVDVSQKEALELAQYRCFASFPIPDRYLEGYDQGQWSLIYDHLTGEFAECVVEHGFQMPPPPSKEVYLAEPRKWSPQDDLGGQVDQAVKEGRFASSQEFFVDVCPMTPPESVLFAD